MRNSRPDFGGVFQVKVLDPFKVFPLRSAAVGGMPRGVFFDSWWPHSKNETTGKVGHAMTKQATCATLLFFSRSTNAKNRSTRPRQGTTGHFILTTSKVNSRPGNMPKV